MTDFKKSLQAIHRMNELGKSRTPFLFIIDFLVQHPIIIPLDQLEEEEILFNINGITNETNKPKAVQAETRFSIVEPDKQQYIAAFEQVMQHLRHGNSYLLNLTMPVKIETNLSLKQIYYRSKARYKLWMKDRFTVFSPEPFVRIGNGKIFSYPMKGTIDATLPDAMQCLLADEKETAEHYTIVDLIRNDLSMVAENVRVDKFRYVEEISTIKGKLLQTSSLISGSLPEDHREQIGSLLFKLLPAGSISGAPKLKTLEIIRALEGYDRNYYTGIVGYFNGEVLDCGVMIRFIEQTPEGMIFKAGGGITVNSRAENEYQELISKVYLPF